MNYELLTKTLTKTELINKIQFLAKIHRQQFNEILYLKMNIKELKEIYIGHLKDFNEFPVQMLKFKFKEKLLNLEIYLN